MELKVLVTTPMKVWCDNKSTISMVRNPVYHDRTKHVEIDRHFIIEKIENHSITLLHIPTRQQTADILTKTLAKGSFNELISNVDLLNIYGT